MENLWPEEITDLDAVARGPLSILKEQAALLGEKTRNIVEGRVERMSKAMLVVSPHNLPFGYTFYLRAPSLGYKYDLFSVFSDVEQYPIYIQVDDDIRKELSLSAKELQTNTENDFKSMLRRIFAARKTKELIQALVSRSKDQDYSFSQDQDF